jgi:hypothetical protein
MLASSMVNPYEKNQGSSSRRNAGGSDDLTFGSSAAREQPIGDDMNTLILARQNAQAGKKRNATVQRRLQKAQTLGAVAGLVGGILAALFGAFFTAAGWFAANEGARQWLSTAGTILLVLTIPLIIFGGYCMDWMDKDKPQRYSKVARYENEDDGQ